MKMIKQVLLLCLLVGSTALTAQKYFTKSGEISFVSSAPMEKIEAFNKNATSVLDVESGKMEFAVLIKSFHFEKALMEEHFNENYMESSKYPKSTFKGAITNLSDVNFTVDGTYDVNVKGELTIHGVQNEIETTGQIIVKDGQLFAKSQFDVAVADYNIKIPKVVADNIAKNVQIEVDLAFELLQQ